MKKQEIIKLALAVLNEDERKNHYNPNLYSSEDVSIQRDKLLKMSAKQLKNTFVINVVSFGYEEIMPMEEKDFDFGNVMSALEQN